MIPGRAVLRPVMREFSGPPKPVSTPIILGRWPEIATLFEKRKILRLPRATPTVTMSFDGGKITACLNDRHAQKSIFVTAESPEEAFTMLDRRLMEDDPGWREPRKYGQ